MMLTTEPSNHTYATQVIRIPSLSPSGKDITDYVQAGGDLWEWLSTTWCELKTHLSIHKEKICLKNFHPQLSRSLTW